MIRNVESHEGLSQPVEGKPELKTWEKPAAKAAEVAQATLAGHATPPVTDFVTCAS